MDDYLALDAGTNHLIEFSEGNIEALPIPLSNTRALPGRFSTGCSVLRKNTIWERSFCPDQEEVTVLTLSGSQYEVQGVFGVGDTAVSALLDGFSIPVSEVFAPSSNP